MVHKRMLPLSLFRLSESGGRVGIGDSSHYGQVAQWLERCCRYAETGVRSPAWSFLFSLTNAPLCCDLSWCPCDHQLHFTVFFLIKLKRLRGPSARILSIPSTLNLINFGWATLIHQIAVVALIYWAGLLTLSDCVMVLLSSGELETRCGAGHQSWTLVAVTVYLTSRGELN